MERKSVYSDGMRKNVYSDGTTKKNVMNGNVFDNDEDKFCVERGKKNTVCCGVVWCGEKYCVH